MSDSESRIVGEFLKYRKLLIRVLLRLSVQPSDVDDILQESLARTLAADRKKRVEFPKSYLYMISRNMVFEENQRRSREVQWEIDEAILEASNAPADEALHYKQMMETFWEALETLPTSHRRAILLRRVYGLSHKEIAKKMGVSVSSVEKYFAQGIKRCEDIMSGRGYGVEKMIAAGRGDARGEKRASNREDRSHD
ncbi:MAG TPA: RNA polymerase sigma factor [Parvularculaceae bacterium]|mgnify:FL=1|nr:RNA polymerase sigma factor [Caulobacterales bacterium]HPE31125.1 RNA polymerase sigma factor [Parvularculaceae bacterium]HRX38464.1 RNA polymerase sigma factor [Parvularculaceae bacterium]